jgi:hypothetical protein
MDEVDRTRAVHQRMLGIEPDPDLFRRIEVGEAIDDILQVGDEELCLRMRRGLASRPARDGRLRNIGDVGEIGSLEPAARAEVDRVPSRGVGAR